MIKRALLLTSLFIFAFVNYCHAQAWNQINTTGFGDPNTEGISVVEFDGTLYAGASNVITGCEIWRYDGGIPWTQINGDGFGNSINAGASLYVIDNILYVVSETVTGGFGIWRYSGGTSWTQISSTGFGDNNNVSATLVSYNSSPYAVTENDVTGFEVWRHNSGSSWTRVDPGAPGPGNGSFGDPDNVEADAPVEHNGNLYLGTNNGATGGEVWQYNGTSWSQINADGFGDPNNYLAMDLVVFNNTLYTVTLNPWTGCEVWRHNSGSSWTQINSDGFGNPFNYASVGYEGMAVLNGKLHIEVTNSNSGCEVWRYEGTTSWTRVDPGAPGAGDGGFGNADNIEIGNMVINNNRIYGATVNDDTGCEVWRYNGNTSWTRIDPGAPIGNGGFGDTNNDYFALIIHNNMVYGNTDLRIFRYVDSSNVPTLSEWGMIIFFMLLVGSALLVLSRKTSQKLS